MPLYRYRCENCLTEFELYQHMQDEPIETCHVCGGKVHRVTWPVNVIFKGNGFYNTDKRKDTGKNAKDMDS